MRLLVCAFGRLRDAVRPRVVGEPLGGRVVVAAEATVLWILVKLLGADDRQLQRDAQVVLLACAQQRGRI